MALVSVMNMEIKFWGSSKSRILTNLWLTLSPIQTWIKSLKAKNILKNPSWTMVLESQTLPLLTSKLKSRRSQQIATSTSQRKFCWRGNLPKTHHQRLRRELNSPRKLRWSRRESSPNKWSKLVHKVTTLVAMPVGDRENMMTTSPRMKKMWTTLRLMCQTSVTSTPRAKPFQISQTQDSRTTLTFSKTWWSPQMW